MINFFSTTKSDLGLSHKEWNGKKEGQKSKYVHSDTLPLSDQDTYCMQHHRQSALTNHKNYYYMLLIAPMNP